MVRTHRIDGAAARITHDADPAHLAGHNGAPYKIEAKLRYRLKDGTLSMWFDLVRDHKVFEAAFMDIWKEIADGTSTTIWRGTPA